MASEIKNIPSPKVAPNLLATKAQAKFQQALSLHQKGQLSQAKALYEEILNTQPKHFDSLHLLGVIALQTKNHRSAVDLIDKAIELAPKNATFYYNRGNALKGLKQLDAAVASYDKAIELKPDFAEACSNRGLALQELKQLDAAVASYDKAIALKLDYAEAYYNRGIVLEELKQFDAAIASYDKAIALKPDYAEACSNRGNALKELKQLDAAVASYDKAIALKPDYAEAYYNRGIALEELKHLDAAVASYDRAIALKPDYAEAYSNRGNALKELKQLDAAVASYDNAIALKPDFAEAYSNRGNALQELEQLDAAVASHDQAIALKPDYAEAYYNRGVALQALKQLDTAIASYDQAIAFKPDYAEAYYNRGVSLQELMQLDTAIASYDKAISLKADHTKAYWNRSLALLHFGNFETGWEEYEWRWKNEKGSYLNKRNFSQPLWLGKDAIAGKTILLHSEQGFGDTIQFCRYAELVADLGAQIVLEVPKPLMSLLDNLSGVAQVAEEGSALPPFDYQCPLMSLPLAFKTTLSNIPANIPYLKASVEKSLFWKEKLGEKNRPRVGLVWSGGFRPNQPEVWAINRRRNIPLDKLAALKHPGVEYYSLQKGQPAESELAELIRQNWDGPDIIDFTSELNDFSDTAALIENLDLVISVDTSTAHLAGAMGKPVWILNRFDACWRWLLDRTDSPWYPTVKLYRQEKAGDWDSVVQHIKADLMRFL